MPAGAEQGGSTLRRGPRGRPRRPVPASQEAAVYGDETVGEQDHAGQVAGVHTLTEDQRTRQDRRDRDQDGDPRQVRRARPRPDPEIDDLDEVQGERGDPDPVEHQGQGRQRREGRRP